MSKQPIRRGATDARREATEAGNTTLALDFEPMAVDEPPSAPTVHGFIEAAAGVQGTEWDAARGLLALRSGRCDGRDESESAAGCKRSVGHGTPSGKSPRIESEADSGSASPILSGGEGDTADECDSESSCGSQGGGPPPIMQHRGETAFTRGRRANQNHWSQIGWSGTECEAAFGSAANPILISDGEDDSTVGSPVDTESDTGLG
jgi:hypothetical protein